MISIVIGLGNPGKKYQHTRHNVGFIAVEGFAKTHQLAFRPHSVYLAEVAEYQNGCLLAKPQTYMNNSGQAVQGLLSYYKLEPTNLLVIHDDVDLRFGQLRARFAGSSGGHKGLESIIKNIGRNFYRLRIGIKNPYLEKTDTDRFVLKPFSRTEKKQLTEQLEYTDTQIDKFRTGRLTIHTKNFNPDK